MARPTRWMCPRPRNTTRRTSAPSIGAKSCRVPATSFPARRRTKWSMHWWNWPANGLGLDDRDPVAGAGGVRAVGADTRPDPHALARAHRRLTLLVAAGRSETGGLGFAALDRLANGVQAADRDLAVYLADADDRRSLRKCGA